jgi:hypothetical protein
MALALTLRAGSSSLAAAAWRADDFDFWAFDRHADDLDARGEPLQLSAPAHQAFAVAREIMLRTQRLAPIRTAASSPEWFGRALAAHRAMHDLTKPLVRADLDHALDTWQWLIRLEPAASAALQLAALLHDIERLASEADTRTEQLAPDYQAFKDAHAHAGATIACSLLDRASVPADVGREACALIESHERTSELAALRTLNDADALSFFSFNSPGYLAYFGPVMTAKKVAYTLARMSPRARAWLPALRIVAGVRAHIA